MAGAGRGAGGGGGGLRVLAAVWWCSNWDLVPLFLRLRLRDINRKASARLESGPPFTDHLHLRAAYAIRTRSQESGGQREQRVAGNGNNK
jgi:hypothetical protein